MRRTFTLGAVTALALSLTACGPDKSREDAHDTVNVDKSAPAVTAFNNHYSNVANKCDGHGHRIYVTTAKVLVVLPDPSCSGYTPETGRAGSGSATPAEKDR